MKRTDNTRARIRSDCRKAMGLPVLILVIHRVLDGAMTVFASNRLGTLTDAVFDANLAQGLESIPSLLFYVGVSTLLVPFIGLAGYILMLKYALSHDELVLGRFLDKAYEAVRTFDKGEAKHRLEWDANDMRCDWVVTMEAAFYFPVVLAVALYHSLQLSPVFTLVVCVIALIKLIVPMLVKKAEKKYDAQTNAYRLRAKTLEKELNERPHLIRLFGLLEPLIAKLDKTFSDYFHTTFTKSTRCTTVADTVSSFLNTFSLLLILLIGAWLVSVGEISAGTVASMAGYFTVYSTVMEDISTILRKIPLIQNKVDRLTVLYDDPETLQGAEIDGTEKITACNLCYAYGAHTALSDVNFTICQGTKTAVCGENGAGKSTLLTLLCGLNRQYSGSLRLNDIELRDCAISSWRSQFAFAQQEPYLFAGTAKDNIHIGNPNASEADVDALLQKLGIAHLADRAISANREELSGGEKQKISIARALLKKSPYLILDEPSNNLDAESLLWLQNFIKSTSKTILFITHDKELAALADQVIYLQTQERRLT